MASTPRSGPGTEGTPPPVALDQVDRSLLGILAGDGRLPIAEVAARANVARATAYNRLERLRRTGVVRGFSVDVDPARAGLGIAALILVSGAQLRWRQLGATLQDLPEVEYAALVTGTEDLALLVRVADMGTLRDFIFERLQSVPGVKSTETLLVVEELLRRPCVVPPP
ncbi:MAG TPA: Lrp/AsnC family transcriptional regulator [Acidimicrobiales bacterium]|nr:Lrp/AsnC family transcriptional regulator [Acidimicrobiales bacterium]